MDIATIINEYGFPALISFGLTYMVEVIYQRQTGKMLSTIARLVLQGVFAFLLLYVPLNIQNALLAQIRGAIAVVAGTSAIWQALKRI